MDCSRREQMKLYHYLKRGDYCKNENENRINDEVINIAKGTKIIVESSNMKNSSPNIIESTAIVYLKIEHLSYDVFWDIWMSVYKINKNRITKNIEKD